MEAQNPERGGAPRWVGAYAEQVLAARGDESTIRQIFDSSPVPMVMIDNERRYMHANTPARLALRQSLATLRQLRIDDLTPQHFLPTMFEAWERLTTTGTVAGLYEMSLPEGSTGKFAYCAFAGALPERYVIVFAPEGWSSDELIPASSTLGEEGPGLTARELQVLQLAANGMSSPGIAEELVLSVTTIRTHFNHIYEKLGVHERAGAVAKAMRLGLIV